MKPSLRSAAVVAFGALSLGVGDAASQELSLDHVVSQVVQTHPSIAAAAAAERGGLAQVREAKGGLFPSLVADANATRFEEPMVVAPIHSLNLQAPPLFGETLLQGRLSAAWTILDGGLNRAGVNVAEAGLEGRRAAFEATESMLIVAAVRAFGAVTSARVFELAQQRRLSAVQQEVDRVDREFQTGTAPELSVLRATAALRNVEADLATASARRDVAERTLARLAGLDLQALRDQPLAPLPAWADDQVSDRAGDLDAHPQYLLAKSQVSAAEGAERAARAQWFPRVQTQAGLVYYDAPDVSGTAEWNVGVGISYPLFTGGRRAAALQKARAERERASMASEARRIELENSLDVAESAVREHSARKLALEAAVRQLVEVARVEALALSAGSGVQAEYLRAEAELAIARGQAAQADAALISAFVERAAAQGILDQTWFEDVFTHSQVPDQGDLP